ncbi:MAG: hypothetical protein Q7S85_09845 [Rugosibacter sp.]|nr:hypothetical protein [Rugosibacter sp.]
MNKTSVVSLLAGAILAVAALSPTAFAADNPFATPARGTQLAAAEAGKEMKCGASMGKEEMKCGAGMKKEKAQCMGEGDGCGCKCKCMEKMKDMKCGAEMKCGAGMKKGMKCDASMKAAPPATPPAAETK